MKKYCTNCKFFEKVGVDYGECRINPTFSYIHIRSTCEDFTAKHRPAKRRAK